VLIHLQVRDVVPVSAVGPSAGFSGLPIDLSQSRSSWALVSELVEIGGELGDSTSWSRNCTLSNDAIQEPIICCLFPTPLVLMLMLAMTQECPTNACPTASQLIRPAG
jgi:hypothetical protein